MTIACCYECRPVPAKQALFHFTKYFVETGRHNYIPSDRNLAELLGLMK